MQKCRNDRIALNLIIQSCNWLFDPQVGPIDHIPLVALVYFPISLPHFSENPNYNIFLAIRRKTEADNYFWEHGCFYPTTENQELFLEDILWALLQNDSLESD